MFGVFFLLISLVKSNSVKKITLKKPKSKAVTMAAACNSTCKYREAPGQAAELGREDLMKFNKCKGSVLQLGNNLLQQDR